VANWQPVAELADVPEGRIHPVSVDGVDLIMVRVGQDVAVYLDSCPHEGHPLSAGNLEGSTIVCAKHLWEFDASSGRHISRVHRPEHDLRKPAARVVDARVEVDVDSLFE
jgi:toluene monooxygenase system ferredoxin subunit